MEKIDGWLVAGGALATAGALLHVAVIAGGQAWYAYFGAPPTVVEAARRGEWSAPAVTLLIAAAIGLCATYAFSGAGLMPRLPLLRLALCTIAFLCIARALLFIPLLALKPQLVTPVETASSLAFLAIGLLYLAGTVRRWSALA